MVLLAPAGGMAGDATLQVTAADGWQVGATLEKKDADTGVEVTSGVNTKLALGTYEISNASAKFGKPAGKPGEEREPVMLWAGRSAQSSTVRITEGANNLRLGPPFRLEFSATVSSEDQADILFSDVAVVGAGGERYMPLNMNANDGEDAKLTWSVRAGKIEGAATSLGYS